MNQVMIVAEIGCNHNGDLLLAKQMIKEAVLAGVDAVKFQTFKSEELVSANAPMADYQKKALGDESQFSMLRKLELSNDEYVELKQLANDYGIECFSTGFDLESLSFLYSQGQRIWKVPSGEITNLPYLEMIRDIDCHNKEIILSTGMSSLDEIQFAVDILQQSKNTTFTILHCNTEYPTNDEDMNLHAMEVLHDAFPTWKYGLSDHSDGIVAGIAAASMGASFIEKHFTTDKSLPGPDHRASITPDELKNLCVGVRRVEVMLGKKEKYVTASEQRNKSVVRKSIVAKKRINVGDLFTEENITCKRPGNGISPIHWYEVIGRVADRNYSQDDFISVEGIDWEFDK